MWKREEPPKPHGVPVNPMPSFDPTPEEPRPLRDERAGFGTSIVISGELSGSEDLTVEGRVEGTIELRDHVLTVGRNGHIRARVTARAIVVLGHVTGNLIASEKIDIRESGSVEGDIVAPRVAIADGSHFRGSIDMQKKDRPATADAPPEGTTTALKPEPSSANGEVVRI